MSCGEVLEKLDSPGLSTQDQVAATVGLLRELVKRASLNSEELQVVAATITYCETLASQSGSAGDLAEQFLGDLLTTLIETRSPLGLRVVFERYGIPRVC